MGINPNLISNELQMYGIFPTVSFVCFFSPTTDCTRLYYASTPQITLSDYTSASLLKCNLCSCFKTLLLPNGSLSNSGAAGHRVVLGHRSVLARLMCFYPNASCLAWPLNGSIRFTSFLSITAFPLCTPELHQLLTPSILLQPGWQWFPACRPLKRMLLERCWKAEQVPISTW